ncbi:hypothetical protein N5C43_07050 [Comamonas terrigena]|uniref:hypothetical protein n=1 Tax=Comamonas terrigena TaxID=32013 RepID=UPI0024491C03|nr:hypothetical protein [Comamonas terrigena]MDH1291014.1 hypothetical protein [Comamonas terrigena]
MHPTTHIPPATPVTPIAHTACALLALRTFGLYTDSPFPQHDYLLDPVSLGLAGLVVALLTLRWWLQGPQAIALSSAPASAPTSAAPASGSSATSADTAAPAPSLDAPLAQLKTAMFAGFWYLGYLFPRRKIAAILQENHPGQASTFDTHFSLYLGIVQIRHFLLAHGLALLMAAYALGEGEAFTGGAVVQAVGPGWMLLCWSVCIYSSCWLLLGAGMALRRLVLRSRPPAG